jgi:O-antigen/teichoic acid export membrane protein
VTHGERDTQGVRDLFESLHRRWTLLVIGGTVIGVLVLYPLITGWLGDGHDQAVVFGAVLIVAYGTGLLSGIPVAYLRALGRPSLEARFGAVLVVWNVALTVALGLAFGAYGVVAATAVAHVIATTWFFRGFHRIAGRELGRIPRRDVARGVGAALVAGCAALGWGLAMIELLPPGVALAAVAAGMAAAGGAYLAFVMEVRPTPTGIRRLLAG